MLNLPRVQGRLTHAFFQALCASKAGKLQGWFFEPVSSSPEEAQDKAFDYNAGLAFARALAGMKI